jgi:hypothetical protein
LLQPNVAISGRQWAVGESNFANRQLNRIAAKQPMSARLVAILNESVERKIENANAMQQVRPEHTAAAAAAEPVYKNRSRIVTAALMLVAVCVVLSSASGEVVCWLAATYAYVDFYGGLLHHVLDDPANLPLPVIGTGCLEFQWHHLMPHDISSESWLDVVGALNALASSKWALIALVVYATKDSPVVSDADRRTWVLLTAVIYLWGVVGQYAHRQAHTPKAKRSLVAATLQRLGLIVDPAFHLAHHQQAFDEYHPPTYGRTYPILSGVSGKLLERMLPVSSNNFVWIGVWATFHFVDVFVLAAVANGLLALASRLA